MFRRSLCALTAVAGLSFAGIAEAHTPGPYPSYRPVYPVNRPQHLHYRVLYRTHGFGPWRVYATYHSDWQAHQMERRLRYSGYEAYVHHGH